MGKYTNADNVKSNYKRFNTVTSLDDPKIEFFISSVENMIDGILYKFYAIPFVNDAGVSYVPDMIKTIALEMATARCVKFYYDSNQIQDNDIIRNIWNDNITLLKGFVAKNPPDMLLPCKFRNGISMNTSGKLEFNILPNDPGGSGFWSTAMDNLNQGVQPIFDLDDWADSRVAGNKTIDINDSRKNDFLIKRI